MTEVLKQPLQTAVTINTLEFEEFNAQELVHIGISVKDFRNIVSHADSLKATITALYSKPTQPLQCSYSGEGLRCEFTLMTIGTFRGSTIPATSRAQTHEPRQQSAAAESSYETRGNPEMPRPLRASVRPNTRRTGALGTHSEATHSNADQDPDSQSMFVSADDDDRVWGPQDNQDDESGVLGWNASADNVS